MDANTTYSNTFESTDATKERGIRIRAMQLRKSLEKAGPYVRDLLTVMTDQELCDKADEHHAMKLRVLEPATA